MLRDQLFNNPGSLLASGVVWILLSFWILGLFQWAVQGDIDFLSALAGICVGIGLGIAAMLAREPYIPPLILIAVTLTMCAFPIVRSSLHKRALAQIDVDAIERAYETLAYKPGNAPVKFKLAKTIYHKGLPAHALALAEEAIQQMPEALFPEEHRILKGWRHYRTPPGQGAISCLDCGSLCQPGYTHCLHCGAPFLLDHARGAWIGKGLARKFVLAWIAIMVALVGIPLVAGTLPAAAAIAVIIGLMAMAILVLATTFRSTREPLR